MLRRWHRHLARRFRAHPPSDKAGIAVLEWRSGDTEGAPALMLRLHCVASSPQLDTIGILCAFCSAGLEELAACGEVPADAWLGALASARGLRRVVLEGGAVHSFCDALRRAEGFLPSLCTLVLARADVEQASQAPAPDRTARALVDMIVLGLAQRAQAGHALSELDVVGFEVDSGC
ncbi:hypothetical protein FA95DRAFT_1679261, partial [Auriscalpium vulgare]